MPSHNESSGRGSFRETKATHVDTLMNQPPTFQLAIQRPPRKDFQAGLRPEQIPRVRPPHAGALVLSHPGRFHRSSEEACSAKRVGWTMLVACWVAKSETHGMTLKESAKETHMMMSKLTMSHQANWSGTLVSSSSKANGLKMGTTNNWSQQNCRSLGNSFFRTYRCEEVHIQRSAPAVERSSMVQSGIARNRRPSLDH